MTRAFLIVTGVFTVQLVMLTFLLLNMRATIEDNRDSIRENRSTILRLEGVARP